LTNSCTSGGSRESYNGRGLRHRPPMVNDNRLRRCPSGSRAGANLPL
jgi:hypothetical protein